MNMNFKLDLNAATLKALIPKLVKAQPLIYGLLLVVVFGFTAYEVNLALNVQPAAQQTAIKALPKISFDTKTIDSLKQLDQVTGEVPLGTLGGHDPF